MNTQTLVTQNLWDPYNGGMPLPKFSNPQELIDAIESLRDQLKLYQKDIAAMVGVTTRAYKFWVAGDRTPNGAAYKMLEKVHEDLSAQVKRMKKAGEKPDDDTETGSEQG